MCFVDYIHVTITDTMKHKSTREAVDLFVKHFIARKKNYQAIFRVHVGPETRVLSSYMFKSAGGNTNINCGISQF